MVVDDGFGCLIFFSTFALTVTRVHTDFLVILLEGSQIFTGFGEFTFFHTFTAVPVDESTLGVHQIELVIETSPSLGNGGGVGQHADGTLYLGQITTGHNSGWLVVNTDLEASGTPVNELNGALGLDGGNGGIDILGHNITTVQHATGHVLAVTRIALNHLVGGFETGVGDF